MKSFGSAADFRFILFIGSILFLLHIAHNKAGSNSVIINSTLSNTTIKKDNALVNSISLNDLHFKTDNIIVAGDDVDSTNSSNVTTQINDLDESTSSDDQQQNLTQINRYNNISIAADTTNTDNPRRSSNISNSGNISIPIYLISDESGLLSALDYQYLAPIWDRNTTYDNILQQAQSIPYHFTDRLSNSSTARDILGEKLKGHNVTVIFHTSPKTASSTLRDACMKTQLETCGIKPRGSSTWPDGYRTPKRLTQFSQCPNTYHFCVKGPVAITKNFTRFESPLLCVLYCEFKCSIEVMVFERFIWPSCFFL